MVGGLSRLLFSTAEHIFCGDKKRAVSSDSSLPNLHIRIMKELAICSLWVTFHDRR
jgi:hypothetical protein